LLLLPLSYASREVEIFKQCEQRNIHMHYVSQCAKLLGTTLHNVITNYDNGFTH